MLIFVDVMNAGSPSIRLQIDEHKAESYTLTKTRNFKRSSPPLYLPPFTVQHHKRTTHDQELESSLKMALPSLIEAHLSQISACADTISTQIFPQPRIFSNALLKSQDITSLIRDTEVHERALFTVPEAPRENRRATVLPGSLPGQLAGGGVNGLSVTGPRRNTAVAAVLGGKLVERIRTGGGAGKSGDVDVDVLLEGAQKLCGV